MTFSQGVVGVDRYTEDTEATNVDMFPSHSPLAALAARARCAEEMARPALLWLPAPSAPNQREEWSYAELWARATAAAAHLRDVVVPLNGNDDNNNVVNDDAHNVPPPLLSSLLSPEHRSHTVELNPKP